MSREKGCEMLSEWIKPCENHIYWSASTTFKTVLWEASNKLRHLPKPAAWKAFILFSISLHLRWLITHMWGCIAGAYPNMNYGWNILSLVQSGIFLCYIIINNLSTKVYQRLKLTTTHKFSFRLVWFKFPSLFFRHILAGVHFNVKCKESDGSERVRVSYPKFKNGEATVQGKIKADFGNCIHLIHKWRTRGWALSRVHQNEAKEAS